MSMFCKILHADSNKPVVVETVFLDVCICGSQWQTEYHQFMVFGLWHCCLVGGYWLSVPLSPWLWRPTVHITAGDVRGQFLNILHYHSFWARRGSASSLPHMVTQSCSQPNSSGLKMEAACSSERWYPSTVWRHVTTKKTTVWMLTAAKDLVPCSVI